MARGRSGDPVAPVGVGSQLDPTLFDQVPAAGDTPQSDPVAVGAMDLSERDFRTRYVEQAPLGSGGMGEVRLCLDTRIGRSVAMKLLRSSSHPDANHRARFLREAQIQAQLDHPAVVPVYDMGLSPEGVAFFTMKRVRGHTLSSVLQRLRAGEPEARRVYSQRRLLTAFSRACLTLDFAHQRGVLHRDLKPANLMLGNFGEVYVLDWGIAAVRSATSWEPEEGESMAMLGSAVETISGAGLLGTPGYIAPEVLVGQPFDPRSEVYALSAILFEILTLEPLHPGSPEERLAATRVGIPAHASNRAPDRDVPPELEELCLRGSAFDPAQRPTGARAMADAVDRYLDGDRDVELRRQRARAIAASARASAERALDATGSLEDRRIALAQVGRAVAFDPNNRIARSVLVQLLAAPPDELPAGASRAYGEAELLDTRRAGRFAAVAYAACIPLGLGPILWMGIREPLLTVLAFILLALASGLGVILSRLRRYRRDVPLVLYFASTTGLALAGFVFGPFVVTPTLVGLNTMAYMFHGRQSPWIAIPYSAALILVPALLESLGVIPPAYLFEGNRIHILPRQVDFPAGPAMTMLTVASAAAVVIGSLYAWYVHRGLADIRRQLHLQAWQLAQTVSDAGGPLTDRRDELPARSLPTSE